MPLADTIEGKSPLEPVIRDFVKLRSRLMNLQYSISPARKRKSSQRYFVLLRLGCLLVFVFCQQVAAQQSRSRASIPNAGLLRIIRAEDERRWDNDLQTLLADKNPAVRRRAAPGSRPW